MSRSSEIGYNLANYSGVINCARLNNDFLYFQKHTVSESPGFLTFLTRSLVVSPVIHSEKWKKQRAPTSQVIKRAHTAITTTIIKIT